MEATEMKKVVYFIPAMLFTVLYGLLIVVGGFGAMPPIIAVWLILFFIGGVLLSKNMFWGSLLGALPAIHWIYMGTQETGQIVNEMPMGIVVLIFYIICGGFVFYKGKKAM